MMREEACHEASSTQLHLDSPFLCPGSSKWMQLQGPIDAAETAVRGQWRDDNTRALLWRLLLGVIPRAAPPAEWGREMSRKRDEYRSLKAEHRVDISKVVDTTDPMSANPLFSGAGSGDDPWRHFYERKEMTDTIKADLERLFPTGCGDHFLAPARQELLLSVLSLWADLHPATGYRQGMHEVLAPLILTLEKEVAAATRAEAGRSAAAGSGASAGQAAAAAAGVTLPREPLESEPLAREPLASEASASKAAVAAAAATAARSSLAAGAANIDGTPVEALARGPGAAATLGAGCSPEDLEADAFWLFAAVMKSLEEFYEHGVNGGGFGQRRRGGSSGGEWGGDSGLDSPVVEMCKRIQGSRMREADPELQRHLAELDISPQLYGMKWARLMCGREFRVEAVMLLWDHIFASSWLDGRPGLPECLESVAVAMVVSIRDQLLAEDNTGCLQLLMRYPPNQSVSTVISLSLSLAQPGGNKTPSGTASDPSFGPAGGTVPTPMPPLATSSATTGRNASAHSDSTPAWLVDKGRAGKDPGSVAEPRQHPRTGASREAERRRVRADGGGDGGNGGGGSGGVAGVFESTGGGAGWEGSNDGGREVKNNWQQGLDEFTRRALNAAHGVAKLAVQTVERSQAAGGGGGGGGSEIAGAAGGVSGSEAGVLASRLRAACAAMEAGEASANVAALEIKEVARFLEQRRGGGQGARVPDSRAARVSSATTTAGRVAGGSSGGGSAGGGGGGGGRGAGQTFTRAFSTYSEDDGCADSLYTRDL